MNTYNVLVLSLVKDTERRKHITSVLDKLNLKFRFFDATTPDDLDYYTEKVYFKNLDHNPKVNRKAVMATFMSHLNILTEIFNSKENTLVLEHDAIVIGDIPQNLSFNKVITLGKPSYGNYNTPKFLGVGPMVQASYTKGAHGYIVSPAGAKALLDKAKTHAETTDIFLNLGNFPWLQEYYPWAVEVRDTFTTIQNAKGCRAKDLSHMLKPAEYEII